MISRSARGVPEAKDWHMARVVVPTTSTGGYQFGKERSVVDVQFVGSDSNYVAIFGVHIADAQDGLAAVEEVVVT